MPTVAELEVLALSDPIVLLEMVMLPGVPTPAIIPLNLGVVELVV
jgi:hypothetical protein